MLFGVCLPVRAVGDIDRASRESVRNNVPLVDVLQHYADQPQPNFVLFFSNTLKQRRRQKKKPEESQSIDDFRYETMHASIAN